MERKVSMSLVQWLLSTIIAGITMALGIGTYIRATFYTRPEGEKLERRIDVVEVDGRQNISMMRDKIDEIYRLLIEQRARSRE